MAIISGWSVAFGSCSQKQTFICINVQTDKGTFVLLSVCSNVHLNKRSIVQTYVYSNVHLFKCRFVFLR